MLRIVPLGGLGEIGLNCMAFEHSGERMLVDCGLMFPRGNMPGVEIIVPDFSWITADPEELKGVVLTHAHEDHIGALPFLLKRLNVPVWGTRFTLGLLRHKSLIAGRMLEAITTGSECTSVPSIEKSTLLAVQSMRKR